MKRHGFTLLEIVAVLTIIIIAAVVLYPIFARTREPRRSICQSNLKQIGIAFRMYSQDFNDKYPLVAVTDTVSKTSAYGWADALQPYLKSTQIYQCDWEATPRARNDSPAQSGYTDYWLNRNLAGREEEEFESVSQTIIVGDGNDGSDSTTARYNISKLPDAWRNDKKSPLYRHLEGSNYAFADGHVKWYKPQGISVAAIKDAEGKPTFAIK
jgi:prepilin-type processing-associated H-X9-DG protein/prepilin-type N-terminal cleavage/methylation domain-containing protein